MNTDWRQLLMDWDKADRDLAALRRHLELCALPEADRKVLVAIKEHGQWVRDGDLARSVLRATMRQLARWATLGPGGVHKAKGRLVKAGLLVHQRGTWTASWSRVWGLDVLPDPADPSSGEGVFTAVHACSRPPKKEERSITPPRPKIPTNQPRSFLSATVQAGTAGSGLAKPVAIGELVSAGRLGEFQAQVADLHDRQVVELARRILCRVEVLEARHKVSEADRIDAAVARRIAAGISAAPDSDTGDELERVLGSMARKEGFETSPAAYLVACAKRRRWLAERVSATDQHG